MADGLWMLVGIGGRSGWKWVRGEGLVELRRALSQQDCGMLHEESLRRTCRFVLLHQGASNTYSQHEDAAATLLSTPRYALLEIAVVPAGL